MRPDMTVADVYNLQKEKIAEVELKDEIFDVPVKKHVLHQVVVSQLANRRLGTASAKSRSEVKFSGKKLWRQKGTGRARVGDAASPTRRGGGVAFGPNAHKFGQKVAKKVRRAALLMALTDKVQTGQIFVIDGFALSEIKTKNLVNIMSHFDVRKALIVTEAKNEKLEKSSRNVPWVKVMRYEGLNVYDILKHDHLFLERSAVDKLEEALVS
jgi:large subunit ribosomal protein L4